MADKGLILGRNYEVSARINVRLPSWINFHDKPNGFEVQNDVADPKRATLWIQEWENFDFE